MSGLDLKLTRVGRRVKSVDLARAMGVSSSRVSVIESLAVVTDETAAKYLDALTTLTTIPSPQRAEVAP